MAIEFKGVNKSYCKFLGKPVPVLKNINLQVPAGQIFGLLGPSGCGKTTLLKCIVNRIKPNNGDITVLGKPLGDPESGVPGHNVGYMPQELALVLELTIAQTLWYTGRLSCMDSVKLKHRMDCLMGILQLPDETSFISELSGGQQRRVSFAVALLHEPQLLILDEPTVGLDPLLRVSIWDHLMKLAQETRATVVITTHYIEEARRAHTIGLMRKGRLLVQSPPKKLLDTYQMTTMEAVFLHLCHQDELNHNSNTNNYNQSIISVNNEVYQERPQINATFKRREYPSLKNIKSCIVRKMQRIHALIYRNFQIVLRRKLSMAFQILLPTLCMILFTATMNDFRGINMGIVNDDESIMGGLYLEQIDSDAIIQKQHETQNSAIESVRQRDASGSLYIHPNFSEATIQRYKAGSNASNETVAESSILVQMDMTEFLVAYFIQKELVTSYTDFVIDLLEYYSVNPAIAQSPIYFEKPIYGETNTTVSSHAFIPGMISQFTFCFAALLTALVFICERNNGVLDRVWVSGVSRTDVTISHFVVQGAFMICQTTIMLVTTFGIYRMPCEGSIGLIVFIVFILGIGGVTFGYLTSAIVHNETAAILVQVVYFLATFFMMGCIWPIEAMPQWLRYLAYIMPQTLPAEGIRSVMLRGWTMQYFQIWLPCLTILIWMCVNTGVSQLIMYIRG